MSMQDRPERPARTKPRPPADAGVDPIDYRPAAPAPSTTTAPSAPDEGKGAQPPAAAPKVEAPAAAAPAAVVPELDITVQSGIRWSPDTENTIRAAKARTGKTRRALVEEAIAQVWGS
ncbi:MULTISPECIES: hypothetical protein [Microbacterium]|jgi:hypothetical protein|uniref:hypothetical protein n=1 Tax=Microbacterium TaxID=33882 RepID=UPI001E4AC21F|nr:hypothetical protein [Microbacterium sp. MEJ108Y]